MLRMLGIKYMALSPITENRIANIENKQNSHERIFNELTKNIADLSAKQQVQTSVLDQHTLQNAALLRDQRQVITTISAIEAIIKTGGILTAFIKWTASLVLALVGIYAAVKMVQTGDFSTLLHVINYSI